MRIMVCETSKDRAKLIEDLLSNYRYRVDVNYESFSLKKIQEVKPALIVLNVSQPENLALLEKMKQNTRYSSIPVIAISRYSSPDLIEKVNKLTNADLLVEPIKIKKFRHMVERWVNFRSLYVD